MLAENFLDHHVKRPGGFALGVPDQAAQALEILRGIAQAIDMIEPQALQPVFGDQPPDQGVHGIEGGGILDAQSGQRVDVKKSPVVDVAGSQPPMAQFVVLAFQQMMQGRDLRRTPRSGTIRLQPARDDIGTFWRVFQFLFERRRFAAIGMAQSPIA